MEDFDSLNEKQLESLERGLSDLKNNRVMTSDEFWKGLSKKETQSLIDEAYENYCKSFENQTLIEQYSFDTDPLTQFMFIDRIKTDKDFSEKWGLTIEERELSPKERIELAGGQIQDKYPALVEMSLRLCDERDIPTRLITLRYNQKTITSYE